MSISGNDLTLSVAPAANTEKDDKQEKKQGQEKSEKSPAIHHPIPRRHIYNVTRAANLVRRDISLNTNDEKNLLGKGTSAKVYKALYKGQTVAVKEFKKNGEGDAEAQVMSQFSSPYITQLIGLSTETPCCWRKESSLLVTEYMAGGDLFSALEKDFSLPPEKKKLHWPIKLKIAFDVSSAVSYLPEPHGDIKIENILLDENYNAKLCDFVPGYATTYGRAPELYRGQNKTMRSDIYSLGYVFLELANGRPFDPVGGNGMIEHVEQLARQGTCPPAFASLIKDCLNIEAGDRPSINQVLERLIALLALSNPLQETAAAHPVEEMRMALTPRNRRR